MQHSVDLNWRGREMKKLRKAAEICNTSASLFSGDREKSHGSVRENHEKIACLWNAYLVARREPGEPLGPLDVLHLMTLLKIARTQHGAYNEDDWLDGVGYFALAGEIAEEDEVN